MLIKHTIFCKDNTSLKHVLRKNCWRYFSWKIRFEKALQLLFLKKNLRMRNFFFSFLTRWFANNVLTCQNPTKKRKEFPFYKNVAAKKILYNNYVIVLYFWHLYTYTRSKYYRYIAYLFFYFWRAIS